MIDANFGINVGQEFQHGPSIFPGGVFPVEQYQSDLDYLWDIGIRRLRQGGNNANFQPAVELQHQAVEMGLAKGFNILYVLQEPFGTKPSDFSQEYYDNYMLPDAQWAQAAGVQAITIGNEREAGTMNSSAGRDQILSMTRVSNVVTIVTSKKHNFVVADTFSYYNAASGLGSGSTIGINSNSGHTITAVIDEYTFQFSHSGTDGTTTIGWIQNSTRTIYKKYKRWATQLKADGITIPLHYSCLQDLNTASVGGWNIAVFVSLGRGDLDFVDLNIYGGGGFPPNSSIPGRFEDFKGEILAGYNGFGADHFMVTEWNLGADPNTGFSTNNRINVKYMMMRLKFLQSKNIPHYHFCWRYPSGTSGRLQAKNSIQRWTGAAGSYIASRADDPATFNDWWWPMIGKRAQTKTVGSPFNNANIFLLKDSRAIPSEPRWEGLAMNYGQSEQSGTYNASRARTAFTNMKSLGITKVRIGMGNYSYTAGINATKNAALLAKSMGLRVAVVPSDKRGYGQSLESEWAAYEAAVLDLAAWAESNLIDEFQIGNELDPSDTTKGGNLSNVITKLLDLGADVKAVYNGVVSYAMAQDRLEADWIALGSGGLSGSLDLLGYNVYGSNGSYTDWVAKIEAMEAEFGSQFYISEFSLHPNFSSFPVTDYDQTAAIRQRIDYLIGSDVELGYFFTWDWIQSNDQFALFKANGTYRPWKDALFQKRTRALTSGRTLTPSRTLT